MRVYTLSDMWSEKKLRVYTASEAKGLTTKIFNQFLFMNFQQRDKLKASGRMHRLTADPQNRPPQNARTLTPLYMSVSERQQAILQRSLNVERRFIPGKGLSVVQQLPWEMPIMLMPRRQQTASHLTCSKPSFWKKSNK